jgi:hypothetical protein
MLAELAIPHQHHQAKVMLEVMALGIIQAHVVVLNLHQAGAVGAQVLEVLLVLDLLRVTGGMG